ncbi:MAG: methyltransferase domain-containing protein [Pseudomonadota bacterium]|nr:methyltransferase domain-containing protein [Pseudomonadota bacterium]
MSTLHDWFQTPPGQYVLAWERARFDAALADVFGYHALQIGLPDIDALAANRMPHRWLGVATPPVAGASAEPAAPAAQRLALVTDATALPFASGSLDLVVLPHALELSPNPHATLSEVHRVLVHEGRVAIAGLNPVSLWGLRQRRARLYQRMGFGRLFLPDAGEFISHWRLRDWLRLLAFELESVQFGCWRPAVRTAGALARHAWMDRAGARWWPVFGAAYFIMAVKRTHGAKLVGAAWKSAPAVAAGSVPMANRVGPASAHTNE